MSATMAESKYFTTHEETDHQDGYTLYRALARMLIGDPARHLRILEAVLQFAISARSNPKHSLHEAYLDREASFRLATSRELFAGLDCPDYLPSEEIYWVVAQALRIRLRVFTQVNSEGQPEELLESADADGGVPIAVLKGSHKKKKMSRFSALRPDESGKDIVEFLSSEAKRMENDTCNEYGGLKIKQISWAWKNVNEYGWADFTCFNEHRPSSSPDNLLSDSPLNRADVFTAVINHPGEIKAALKLFHEAMRRAPNQRRAVQISGDGKSGAMKPHCSVDAEFIKYPEEDVLGKSEAETKWLLREGHVEELRSVLTVAVGRHFTLSFNILHMLKNPKQETVPALSSLFEELIFNPEIMKLWWNLQSDIQVMDNTIAYLFQGTHRPSIWYTSWKAAPVRLQPTFKIHSQHFNGTRPDSLTFPKKHQTCGLHAESLNGAGISCPCELGNIDIAALVNHFCRLHGIGITKMGWDQHRHHFNYETFLYSMLQGNRLYPLMSHLKHSFRKGDLARSPHGFYQSLGQPGMELDDGAMGYNIGDVIGQNIIFEQLFASDDRDLLANCLHLYARAESDDAIKQPQRQAESAFGTAAGIALFEDNVRLFKTWRTSSAKTASDGDSTNYVPFTDPSLWTTQALRPWDHDKRAHISRNMTKRSGVLVQHNVYKQPSEQEWSELESRKQDLLHRLRDPTRFWIPETCANITGSTFEQPILRASMTHSEGIIELLNSARVPREVTPPPGFGCPLRLTDDLLELPDRIAGASMTLARDIYLAFPSRPAHIDESKLGHLRRFPPPTLVTKSSFVDTKQLAGKALEDAKQSTSSIYWDQTRSEDRWEQAKEAKTNCYKAIARELSMNEQQGPPGIIDHADIFDPEGREYRRAVEAAAEWNKPDLRFTPETYPDGKWKSEATLTLVGLDAMAKDEDIDYVDWKLVTDKTPHLRAYTARGRARRGRGRGGW
jgi:hypothetical protein